MAKKDNKSHHDKGVTLNVNRQEHANSFIQRRDPRLNQQQIAKQNIAQNHEEGNANYEKIHLQLAETALEFDVGKLAKDKQPADTDASTGRHKE